MHKKRKRHLRKPIKTMLLIIFAVFIIRGCTTADATAPNQEQTITYTVRKNDKLWTIAKKYKADEEDIRQYIYDIQKINNMETATIYEGEQIQIILRNSEV